MVSIADMAVGARPGAGFGARLAALLVRHWAWMSDGDDRDVKEDMVLLHSPTESGDGIRVVRKREDAIEIGELRPMREGQPIHGEVVRLTQREEHALLFDCEVVVPSPEPKEPAEPAEPKQLSHKGPARVTTDAYRGGWDLIFGQKHKGPGEAPN